MIKEFVDRFMERKIILEKLMMDKHPEDYKALVHMLVKVLQGEDEYESPDPARIHEINDGGYQGTLIYVIGAGGCQPSTYWYTEVSYGSCSGCDTLQAIQGYSDEPPTPEQIAQYMTLCLHMVQGMKKMGDE
jgi:hypothetical protein